MREKRLLPYFYDIDDEGRFAPTPLASSPWESGKQNGAGLGGLLAHLIDGVAASAPMTVARLTIDILGAAPMAPVEGRTRIVRDGERFQVSESELWIADRLVARACALRTRIADTPVIDGAPVYPPPEDCPVVKFMSRRAFGQYVESRTAGGNLHTPGPLALWVRFGHQHVRDVPLTPLVRAATLGDFGGGVGAHVDGREWSFANLDIALHLTREPEGEWLLIHADTMSAGNGVAHANALFADRRGAFARGHQTLFIAPQPQAAVGAS